MVFDELTILVGCGWKTRPRVGFGSSKPNSPRGTGKGLVGFEWQKGVVEAYGRLVVTLIEEDDVDGGQGVYAADFLKGTP